MAAFRATNSAATAKWRWTCSHVADAAPEWPALLAATTTATPMLRADPSYPTAALFHVSLTLRKILKYGVQKSHRRPRASSCRASFSPIHKLTLPSLKRSLNMGHGVSGIDHQPPKIAFL